jgi:two-component system NtrC family sensor kinase
MTATQDETIVDLQRANAELQRERDAALAREAALVEVQRVIAGSPGDSQQVLDLIAQHAMKLCEVPAVGVALFDGTTLHLAAQIGFDTAYAEDYAAQFPRRAARDTAMGRAILSQCVVQIENADADPEYGIARPSGAWSALAVPLMRNGSPLGVISVGRPVTGVYPNSQATLLQSFADQAVIAIHNAETHRALQTRTGDLQESLEYQTATSEVLKVISRSTFDLQPVFQTVADTAVRLCHADQAGIYLDENGEYRWASGCSQLPEYERIEREARIRPGTGTLVGRVALEGRPVQILDAWTDTEYEAKEDARVGAIHTLLGIPLLRDGSPIGVIGLGRQKIEPFTERQIELVGTFAAQAVIAIENARLITEQREALEQQIATAEVLQVINASPGNLGPVFDTVLESALRLCAASFGALLAYDGEHIERVALLGVPPPRSPNGAAEIHSPNRLP